MQRVFYTFTGVVSRPVTTFLFRLRASGVGNVPPEGGAVLAANHSSNFDPWALGMPLFPKLTLRFMAKKELFNPVLKPLLEAIGAFPVRRGIGDHEAIEHAVRLAREGYVVVMFPEGTRRTKGLKKRFEAKPHSGAARVALAAGVPLIPAAVRGTDRLSRLGPIRVAYGRPIDVSDLEGQTPRNASQTATDRLMAAIEELLSTL